jgi:superfamily II DNA or RNA helicase
MQKFTQGEIVRVRRRRWRVAEMRTYEHCELLTLAGAEPAIAGVTRLVLAPFDTIERLPSQAGLRRVGMRRWRRGCRALLADAAPPGALRSARRARIDLLPHQLEPALAVLRGLGTRMLLADEVGLGKTVQAALVVAELRARGAADRVLVLTPAGLREQWAAELAARLQIDAIVVDATTLRRRASTLPLDVNPWSTVATAIASVDYVKRPDILRAVAACRWDMIVVDEAHGVSAESDRHSAVALLARRAPYVLLLTATPHNGDRRAFASLCRLGMLADDRLLLFRRTRNDVRGGAKRRVHHLHVRCSPAEARMHALLARFIAALRRERGDAIALAVSVLQKRALSSARSLERTVRRRLDALDARPGVAAHQLALPLVDPSGELTPADEDPEWQPELTLADAQHERRLLAAVAAAARIAGRDESKAAALTRFVRRTREPIVVFTEYRDTLQRLGDSLASLGAPFAILHGGLDRGARSAALAAFTTGAVRILLSTDAAGEGVNLHYTCRIVANLELPWNPMRLEQRIGRVDRIGQRHTVHAIHFIARDTVETRILVRLRDRVARARRDIGAPDPIGLDDEHDIARFAIGAPDFPLKIDGGSPINPPVFEPPDLTLEAICEAARVGAARARANDADARQGDIVRSRPAWFATVRRAATRSVLAGRVLLIYEATMEDGFGRVAERAVVPLTWTPRRRLDRDVIHTLLQGSGNARLIDAAISGWRQSADRVHAAFLAARLAREEAIATAADPRIHLLQPGLFDRRAQADRDAATRAAHDDADGHVLRLASLARTATVAHQEPRLLLVLAP